LLWLALLVVIGWSVSQRLEMSGDLRKFMPAQNINSRATKHDAARAACAIGRATAFGHIAMKARP
jgi:predicted exporter